jgi:hypothetical protein
MEYNTGIMDGVQYRYYGCSTIPYYGWSTIPVLWMEYNTGIMDGVIHNTGIVFSIHNTGIVLHP